MPLTARPSPRRAQQLGGAGGEHPAGELARGRERVAIGDGDLVDEPLRAVGQAREAAHASRESA